MLTLMMLSMIHATDEMGTDHVTPTVMNAEYVRSFYPRREDRNGCRIVFDDGGGWAVSESYADIKAKMQAAGLPFVELTETKDAPAAIDEDTGEVINSGDERLAPVSVRPDFVRCFYPRKDNKVGTRLTFNKSAGLAVHELFEQVAAAFGAVASRPLLAPPQG